MMIQPFNTDDENNAPAYWVLERVLRECSLSQVLDRFYADFDCADPYTLLPISVVYNPEKNGQRIFSFQGCEAMVVIYRRGYYVVVEKHFRSIEGPHPCFLYYKSNQTGEVAWVATLQMSETMFYNDVAVVSRISKAIEDHEFYQSEKSGQTIVLL